MKVRITNKRLKAIYKVQALNYGEAQTLLSFMEPYYYTCGVYGWNSDVYTEGLIAVSAGDRPVGYNYLSSEEIASFEKAAKEIAAMQDAQERSFNQKKIVWDFFQTIKEA